MQEEDFAHKNGWKTVVERTANAIESAGHVALFRMRRVSLSFGLGILQSDVRESGDGNRRPVDEGPHFAEDASDGSGVFV